MRDLKGAFSITSGVKEVMMTVKLLGAIEAGGTKFVCGIGNEEGTILDRTSFPTTTPEETMKLVQDYF